MLGPTGRLSGSDRMRAGAPAGLDRFLGMAFGRVERPDPDRRTGQSGQADSRSALLPNPWLPAVSRPVGTARGVGAKRGLWRRPDRTPGRGHRARPRRTRDGEPLIRKRQWTPSEYGEWLYRLAEHLFQPALCMGGPFNFKGFPPVERETQPSLRFFNGTKCNSWKSTGDPMG